jgi:hypothetical protein
MKVHMAVFQLKGSALLWWKTLLPQLNMTPKTCHGNYSRNNSERGTYQRNSLSITSMISTPYDRAVRTMPKYEAYFMELIRYALHINTVRLKVNMFLFGLNVNIRAKVRILMPQTLHDVIQKALIAEEELIGEG